MDVIIYVATKQNFDTHPIQGQSHKFVYVYVFYPLKRGLHQFIVWPRAWG